MSNRRTTKTLRAAFALCAFALLLALSPATSARREGESLQAYSTPEGRLRIFDEVWEQVRERYFDPGFQGVDWQEVRGQYRPRAASARGRAELYAVLRRMLGTLRDPHTRVFAPGESTDWRVQRYVSVGVAVRELSGQVVVTDVERDSEAEEAGLRAGDAVLALDGEPAPAVVARRLAEQGVPASPSSRLLAVGRLFEGERGTPVRVTYARDGSRREREATLRREPRTRLPSFEVRSQSSGVRLVRFNIFTPEVAAQFARALRDELKDARALVIDLRDNGGGEAESMADLASTLLPAGLSLGRFTDRAGAVRLEPHTRAALLSTADSFERFRRPVVLLVNARTASAAEVFAAALRETNRASVIGEATCGCVLGIRRRHRLPDGGVLDVSEMDYHTAAGTRLEGAGLRPDVTVEPTRDALRRRRDRALERALEILKDSKSD
ncbi:MAG: carboxyl-terminal processing protease [Sphingomonadales bacterium]|jgi:carboxyl-terminal processing protease|nr:carboxyl-terminal processing protease [Sphingomonadales bacterium]